VLVPEKRQFVKDETENNIENEHEYKHDDEGDSRNKSITDQKKTKEKP